MSRNRSTSGRSLLVAGLLIASVVAAGVPPTAAALTSSATDGDALSGTVDVPIHLELYDGDASAGSCSGELLRTIELEATDAVPEDPIGSSEPVGCVESTVDVDGETILEAAPIDGADEIRSVEITLHRTAEDRSTCRDDGDPMMVVAVGTSGTVLDASGAPVGGSTDDPHLARCVRVRALDGGDQEVARAEAGSTIRVGVDLHDDATGLGLDAECSGDRWGIVAPVPGFPEADDGTPAFEANCVSVSLQGVSSSLESPIEVGADPIERIRVELHDRAEAPASCPDSAPVASVSVEPEGDPVVETGLPGLEAIEELEPAACIRVTVVPTEGEPTTVEVGDAPTEHVSAEPDHHAGVGSHHPVGSGDDHDPDEIHYRLGGTLSVDLAGVGVSETIGPVQGTIDVSDQAHTVLPERVRYPDVCSIRSGADLVVGPDEDGDDVPDFVEVPTRTAIVDLDDDGDLRTDETTCSGLPEEPADPVRVRTDRVDVRIVDHVGIAGDHVAGDGPDHQQDQLHYRLGAEIEIHPPSPSVAFLAETRPITVSVVDESTVDLSDEAHGSGVLPQRVPVPDVDELRSASDDPTGLLTGDADDDGIPDGVRIPMVEAVVDVEEDGSPMTDDEGTFPVPTEDADARTVKIDRVDVSVERHLGLGDDHVIGEDSPSHEGDRLHYRLGGNVTLDLPEPVGRVNLLDRNVTGHVDVNDTAPDEEIPPVPVPDVERIRDAFQAAVARFGSSGEAQPPFVGPDGDDDGLPAHVGVPVEQTTVRLDDEGRPTIDTADDTMQVPVDNDDGRHVGENVPITATTVEVTDLYRSRPGSAACAGDELFTVEVSPTGIETSPAHVSPDLRDAARCARLDLPSAGQGGDEGPGSVAVPIQPCVAGHRAGGTQVDLPRDLDCSGYTDVHELTACLDASNPAACTISIVDSFDDPTPVISELSASGGSDDVLGPKVEVSLAARAQDDACDPTLEPPAKGCLTLRNYRLDATLELDDGRRVTRRLTGGATGSASLERTIPVDLAFAFADVDDLERAEDVRFELTVSDGFGSTRATLEHDVDLGDPIVDRAAASPGAIGERTDDASTQFVVDVTDSSPVDIGLSLVDPSGRTVRSWSSDGVSPSDVEPEMTVDWDGRQDGEQVPDGVYDLRVAVSDAPGNGPVTETTPAAVIVNDEGPSIASRDVADVYEETLDLSVTFASETEVTRARADLSHLGLGQVEMASTDGWSLSEDLADTDAEDGLYRALIWVETAASSEESLAGAVDLRIDRHEPTATLSDLACEPSADAPCTFGIDVSEPATVDATVRRDGETIADLGSSSIDSSGELTWSAGGVAEGPARLEVGLTDEAGRSTTVAEEIKVDASPPRIDLNRTGDTVTVRLSDLSSTCATVTVDGDERVDACRSELTVAARDRPAKIVVEARDALGHRREVEMVAGSGDGSQRASSAIEVELLRPESGSWLTLHDGPLVVRVDGAGDVRCGWDSGPVDCRFAEGKVLVDADNVSAGRRTLTVEASTPGGSVETGSWTFRAGTEGLVDEVEARAVGDQVKLIVHADRGLALSASLDCGGGSAATAELAERAPGRYVSVVPTPPSADCSATVRAATPAGEQVPLTEVDGLDVQAERGALPGFELLGVLAGLAAAVWIVRRQG